jgi:UDP-N-acetylmuramyl pentapeptide synthase
VRDIVAPGDTVLVKGSRGVGLEVVAQGLRDAAGD